MSQAPTGPFVPAVIDWDEFGGIVRAVYFTVKRALVDQKPDICRHVMTEDAWQNLRAQVDVEKLDEARNVQSGLTITQLRPGNHDVDGDVDRVTVGLLINGVDCVINAAGAVVRGTRNRSDWLEEWTFERSRDPALLAQATAPKCPACGAPLSIDSDGLCTFCQASVPGAKTDWLLASIGTPSQVPVDPYMNLQANVEAGKVVMSAMVAQNADHPWVGSPPTPPNVTAEAAAGIASIQARDPAFNASGLVVEAREAFLTLEESRNQLMPAHVRAMVGDGLYALEVDRARQLTAAGRNEVRAYLDIKDVTLVAVSSEGGRDRLIARVRAVSARSVVDLQTGNLLEGSAVTHPWAEDLVFERASTATTNELTGLMAHRCPSCGQPSMVADDGTCASCGQHVTGGEKDWILVDVQPVPEPPPPGLPG